jgi:hypothetical protein
MHQADIIIGETNQGGDMVETIIRGIDTNVAFRGVRATRGKYTRAEPVAALYERGLVHHVGAFPELEDQLCLRADTLIATEHGQRRIDTIQIGDRVWTSKGLRRVVNAGCTSPSAEVYELSASNALRLVATMGHPVYNKRVGKFVPMSLLRQGDTLEVLSCQEDGAGAQRELTGQRGVWASMGHKWNGTGGYGELTGQIATIDTLVVNCCTGLFGKMFTGQFHQDIKSIIKTKTRAIMTSLIWNCSHIQNILSDICTVSLLQIPRLEAVKVGSNGRQSNRVTSSVNTAERPTRQQVHEHGSAHTYAPLNSIGTATIETITKIAEPEPVYNIEVEDAPEYYANSIRVHNCSWTQGEKSPDRLDALVWLLTALMLNAGVPLSGDEPIDPPVPVPTITQLMASDPFQWASEHGMWEDN